MLRIDDALVVVVAGHSDVHYGQLLQQRLRLIGGAEFGYSAVTEFDAAAGHFDFVAAAGVGHFDRHSSSAVRDLITRDGCLP